MSFRRYLFLFYYTQIPLVLLAIILTSSISAVLYTEINWRVSALVGISTFFTYSLDNLFDWKKDQQHYQDIKKAIEFYHKISYGLILLSGLGVLLLTLTSPNDLRIGMLLLGASAGMLTARFANYRNTPRHQDPSLINFFIHRFLISIIWTIVVVFMPIWYDGRMINSLTWHTLFFMFNLIFVYAVLWKFEKTSLKLKRRILSSRFGSFLFIPPIISVGLIFYDIFSGLRTYLNLLNLIPISIALLYTYNVLNKPYQLRQKIAGLTFLLIITIPISAFLHIYIG